MSTTEAGVWFQGPDGAEHAKNLFVDFNEQVVTLRAGGYMKGPFTVEEGWTVVAEEADRG